MSTKFLVNFPQQRGCANTCTMYSIRAHKENDLGRRYWPLFSCRRWPRWENIGKTGKRRALELSRVCQALRNESHVGRLAYLRENIAFHWQLSTFRYAFTISPVGARRNSQNWTEAHNSLFRACQFRLSNTFLCSNKRYFDGCRS